METKTSETKWDEFRNKISEESYIKGFVELFQDIARGGKIDTEGIVCTVRVPKKMAEMCRLAENATGVPVHQQIAEFASKRILTEVEELVRKASSANEKKNEESLQNLGVDLKGLNNKLAKLEEIAQQVQSLQSVFGNKE